MTHELVDRAIRYWLGLEDHQKLPPAFAELVEAIVWELENGPKESP